MSLAGRCLGVTPADRKHLDSSTSFIAHNSSYRPALSRVRDNIANFGGDPGCVIIYGQSGGGSKVTTFGVR